MRKPESSPASRLICLGGARALTMAPGEMGHPELEPPLEYNH